MKFQAALFDLDGTLIDSTADIAWSANALLARHGYPTHPLASFNRFIGDGVKNLVLRILPEAARTPERVGEFIKEYRELYANHWNVDTYVYPGISELLAALQQNGVRLAVLSNKPHDFTVQCVSHFLGSEHFEMVMGASERFPNKPDPAAALDIARQLGLAPADIVYLGDTDTDMQTAVSAGMYPVGVAWGLRSREELGLNGAKSLIGHPRELLRMMGLGE